MITDNVNWALATCLASLLWKKKIVIISGDTTKKACPHIELMTQLSWPKLSSCVALFLQLHLAGVFKKLSTDVRAVLHLLMAIHHIHAMDQSIESLCQLCIMHECFDWWLIQLACWSIHILRSPIKVAIGHLVGTTISWHMQLYGDVYIVVLHHMMKDDTHINNLCISGDTRSCLTSLAVVCHSYALSHYSHWHELIKHWTSIVRHERNCLALDVLYTSSLIYQWRTKLMKQHKHTR